MQAQQERQLCARWECKKRATYERPFCYAHWGEWQAGSLEECVRCHWFYGFEDIVLNEWTDLPDQVVGPTPDTDFIVCSYCIAKALHETGKVPQGIPSALWHELVARLSEHRPPPPARVEMKRLVRYVYVLKNTDGSLYVGQTVDLAARLREHQEGQQAQTRGKNPRLVYFRAFLGEREEVNRTEGELIKMANSPTGRRRLMNMIAQFREPLKLLDLNT